MKKTAGIFTGAGVLLGCFMLAMLCAALLRALPRKEIAVTTAVPGSNTRDGSCRPAQPVPDTAHGRISEACDLWIDVTEKVEGLARFTWLGTAGVDADAHNHNVHQPSPVIDAGTPDGVTWYERDYDHLRRINAGERPGHEHVDVSKDENSR